MFAARAAGVRGNLAADHIALLRISYTANNFSQLRVYFGSKHNHSVVHCIRRLIIMSTRPAARYLRALILLLAHFSGPLLPSTWTMMAPTCLPLSSQPLIPDQRRVRAMRRPLLILTGIRSGTATNACRAATTRRDTNASWVPKSRFLGSGSTVLN